MSSRQTRDLERDPAAAELPPDLQAFVALAVAVTSRPWTVTPELVATAASAARSRRQYLDAVGVMFAFNFVTRVANSLGVVPDMPGWLRRRQRLRQFGLRVMALGLRLFVDLSPRQVPGPPPREHLEGLSRLFGELDGGPLPGWFETLAEAPPVLATARECLEALLRRGEPDGTILLDRARFLAVGRVVLCDLPEATDLTAAMPPESPGEAAAAGPVVARFARDVNSQSNLITQGRIDELRGIGLRDPDVLDLVVAAAIWAAVARLELLVKYVPPAPVWSVTSQRISI